MICWEGSLQIIIILILKLIHKNNVNEFVEKGILFGRRNNKIINHQHFVRVQAGNKCRDRSGCWFD